MANVDRPMGAIPVGRLGSVQNFTLRKYAVDSANATAIFRGDFVKLEDDGNVAPAVAGDALLGVCMGAVVNRSVAATEHPGYLPASTAGHVLVLIDKDVILEIQEDGNMGTAVVGSNGDIVAGAGSTTTGRSAHELDSSDVTANDAVAASAQLRVLAVVDSPDNDGTLANAKWL